MLVPNRGYSHGLMLRREVEELKPSDTVSEAGGRNGCGVCPAGLGGGSLEAPLRDVSTLPGSGPCWHPEFKRLGSVA